MLRWKLLPWEYAIRNLFRRPLRTGLTLLGLTTVVVLVLVVVGFIRGLERSLMASSDPRGVVVFSLGMGENIEYSSIPGRTGDLLVRPVFRAFGSGMANGISPRNCTWARRSRSAGRNAGDGPGAAASPRPPCWCGGKCRSNAGIGPNRGKCWWDAWRRPNWVPRLGSLWPGRS